MRTIAELTRAILADGTFPALRDHVVAATGLEYYAGRPSSFAEQIAHRIIDLGLDDCGSYLHVSTRWRFRRNGIGPTDRAADDW